VTTAKNVAQRYAAKVTRQIGTCGVCGKTQKIPNGMLSYHGYNRPGYGYIEGECPGSRHAPWEVSSITGEVALQVYNNVLNKKIDELRDAPQLTELPLIKGNVWTKSVYLKKEEVNEIRWKATLQEYEKHLQSEVKKLKSVVQDYEKAVRSWKPSEVVEVNELKVEREKQQKRDDVHTKRLERYEALKAKAMDRLTRAWVNLKKKELKAHSNPTPKNIEEVAKTATIIYSVYVGAAKLAQAHPERSFEPRDVLADFNTPEIWKHMGLLQGSTYLDLRQAEKLQDEARTGTYGFDNKWKPFWPGYGKARMASTVAARYLSCQG